MSEKIYTILYIEDDPSGRRLVERVLQPLGYHVLTADRAFAGLDTARQYEPDLILTDINLPDMSGPEVVALLRREERFATTPIVALTAQSAGTPEWEMAFAAGITGFLTKPIEIDNFHEQIAHYLHGGNDTLPSDQQGAIQSRYSQSVIEKLEARIEALEQDNARLMDLEGIKEAFIQITAHELRTPLTLVFGYTRLLEEICESLGSTSAELAMLVSGLGESVERMQNIIDEIVIVSRILTNKIDLNPKPIDAASILLRSLQHFNLAIEERDLQLHFDLRHWYVRLYADGALLHLMLVNLLSNAIKYTPDGGRIYINAVRDREHLRISLRDTGIGIDTVQQAHIFDRFHPAADIHLHSTSKTAFRGGGLGMGLSICKGIVQAHGGQIWVESSHCDPDTLPGSEFIVVLPLNSREK